MEDKKSAAPPKTEVDGLRKLQELGSILADLITKQRTGNESSKKAKSDPIKFEDAQEAMRLKLEFFLRGVMKVDKKTKFFNHFDKLCHHGRATKEELLSLAIGANSEWLGSTFHLSHVAASMFAHFTNSIMIDHLEVAVVAVWDAMIDQTDSFLDKALHGHFRDLYDKRYPDEYNLAIARIVFLYFAFTYAFHWDETADNDATVELTKFVAPMVKELVDQKQLCSKKCERWKTSNVHFESRVHICPVGPTCAERHKKEHSRYFTHMVVDANALSYLPDLVLHKPPDV